MLYLDRVLELRPHVGQAADVVYIEHLIVKVKVYVVPVTERLDALVPGIGFILITDEKRSKSSQLYIAYNFNVYSVKVVTSNTIGNMSVLDTYILLYNWAN